VCLARQLCPQTSGFGGPSQSKSQIPKQSSNKTTNSTYNTILNSLLAWRCAATVGGKVKVKWSRYRSGVAQRVGRGIALLFHNRGTRRGWVVSSTPRPHFTPGKDAVPILQEAGWALGPVWTGGKSCPHRDSIPNRPARSQSVYRLSYPSHTVTGTVVKQTAKW